MGASFSFSSEWRILNYDSRERMLHLFEMLNISSKENSMMLNKKMIRSIPAFSFFLEQLFCWARVFGCWCKSLLFQISRMLLVGVKHFSQQILSLRKLLPMGICVAYYLMKRPNRLVVCCCLPSFTPSSSLQLEIITTTAYLLHCSN